MATLSELFSAQRIACVRKSVEALEKVVDQVEDTLETLETDLGFETELSTDNGDITVTGGLVGATVRVAIRAAGRNAPTRLLRASMTVFIAMDAADADWAALAVAPLSFAVGRGTADQALWDAVLGAMSPSPYWQSPLGLTWSMPVRPGAMTVHALSATAAQGNVVVTLTGSDTAATFGEVWLTTADNPTPPADSNLTVQFAL
jgi:hypothetical protein